MAIGNTDPETPVDDEEEWEYEYHPTETETFYVTLDLSTAPNQTEKGDSGYYFHSRRPRPILQKKAVDEDTVNTQDGVVHQNDKATNAQPLQDAEPQIQILGLESNEPIISYQGQVFRCSWQTAVGTDMLFAAPEHSPADVEPLVKDPKFNLLATTNIKLVGEAVELIRKEKQPGQIEKPGSEAAERISESQTGLQVAGENDEADTPNVSKKPYSILIEDTPSTSRKRQASFLESLMAAKTARGETDEVYIGRGKQYRVHGEERLREGRRLPAELADGEEDDQEESLQNQSILPKMPISERKKRPYKKRARGPNASSTGGGLFRDFGIGEEGTKDQENDVPESPITNAALSENAPERMPQDVYDPEIILEGASEAIPEDIQKDLPEDVPEDYFHAWRIDTRPRQAPNMRARRGKPRSRPRGRASKQLRPI